MTRGEEGSMTNRVAVPDRRCAGRPSVSEAVNESGVVGSEVSLSIAKPVDARGVPRVLIAVELDGVGRVDIELNAGAFASLLAGTVLVGDALWRPEVTP